MNCKDCKYIIEEEADDDLKAWGILKSYYCKRYEDFIAKFNIPFRISSQLYVSPENDGNLCCYFKKNITKIK